MDAADEATFREFVVERQSVLRRRAYLLCGNWSDGDELVQEALARVYTKWTHIAAPARTAYVRKAMLNIYLNDKRRRGGREVLTETLPERPAPDPDQDMAMTLRRLLADLPERQRAVVVLRFWEDLTVPQIAEATGVNEGTIKSQISRAVAVLRDRLAEPPMTEAGALS